MNKSEYYKGKTQEWVETASLLIDVIGCTTILILTGILVSKCFF